MEPRTDEHPPAHVEEEECASVFGRIVRETLGERDPERLVRHTLARVHQELGAAWSGVLGTGDSVLGALRVQDDCPDFETRVEGLNLRSEAPAERYEVRPAAGGLLLALWLPQHTRLVFLFGPSPPAAQRWVEVLDTIGRFLLTRLYGELELRRAVLANAALEHRISDLSLLFKGLDVSLLSVEPMKVLRSFLTCVTSGEAIGFNRAFLLLIDEEQTELRGVDAVGPSSGEEASTIWNSIERERKSFEEILNSAVRDPEVGPAPGSLADRIRRFKLPLDPAQSLLTRAATLATPGYDIYEYRRDMGHDPFAEAFGANEFVAIPILGRERTLGVIVADNLFTGRPVERENVYLVSGLANHVGVVIENALMFEDMSRRYDELNEVQFINRKLLSSSDYGEVLSQIAKVSKSMLDATGALLFMAEGHPPEPRLEVSDGPPLLEAGVRRCLEIARETLERRTGVLVRDATPESYHTETGVVVSLLSAPMKIDNEAVGVLMVYRLADVDPEHTVRFDRSTQRFLSIIADQAAIALLSGKRLRTIREDQRLIQQLNEFLYRNEKLAALGEVSSKIAHEIRNPLTALGGFARRMLKSQHLAVPDREATEIIVRETTRLERILNDQLWFARSASLHVAPTSLDRLVRETHVLLRQQIQTRQVHLQLDLRPDLPDVVLDGDRVKQVLVNLLMNALEAVEPGGRILVSTQQAGDCVEIEVANTGPKIAPEVAATMFMPFATTKKNGTGLGMAVVHQIVTEHRGHIQVLSRDPWGSILRISFPLQTHPDDSSTVSNG